MLKKIFAPGNDSFFTSFGLLILRVWLGLSLLHHGWGKLSNFKDMSSKFPDPLGVGHTTSLALVVFAEVLCAILLALGFITRFAALVTSINVGVAFFAVHKAALSGEHSGELAFIYLAGFVALFFAGAGKISLDKAVFGGGAKAPPSK